MQCQLMESLFQVIRALHREENVARDYGAGGPLYHAEVNLLDAIYRYPQNSVSALASILNITNSALTQTAKKLLDKGLVEQYNPPRNHKVKYHRLTEAGEIARQGHLRCHAQATEQMKSFLCTRPPEEKKTLQRFFSVLGQCMPVCLYECEQLECSCHAQAYVSSDV